MPYTTQLNCNTDTIAKALLSHQEKVGEIVIDVHSQLETLKTQADRVVDEYTDPIKLQLGRVLAPTGRSVESMIAELGLMTGTTKTEIETNVKDRYGLSIVNGRLLVPGSTNLETVREMYRLLGSTDAIKTLIPELASFDINDRFNVPTIEPRFVALFTKKTRTEIEGDKCTSDSVVDTETLLGIDTNINRLTANNEIGRERLIANIFWIGSASATPGNRRKAYKLGFTDDEFVSMVTKEGVEDYDAVTMRIKVWELTDPFIINKIENQTGDEDDTNDIISRGPTKLNLNPSTQEVFSEAKKILNKKANANTSSGAKDFSSGPTSLMQVIDIEKTFDPNGTISNYSPTSTEDPCFIDVAGLAGDMNDIISDAHEFMGDVLSAVGAPQKALNELMAGLSSAASGALNELTSVLGAVNNTLGDPDFLQCFFGAGFSLDLNFGNILGPLDSLLSLLEDGLGVALDFLDLIGDILSSIGQLACIQAALSQGIMGSFGPVTNALANLGINCVIKGPDLPKCLQEALDIGELASDFAWNLLAAALNGIRALYLSLSNLSIGLRGSIATNAGSTCNPAETALLTAALIERTLALDEVLSL